MNRRKQQHHWINRRYHRARVDLPCELCFPGGGPASVRILNLSVGGLKFCCGQEVLFALLPEGQRVPGQVAGVEVGIRFQFKSVHDNQTSLRTNVSVVHTERLAQDKYHVGVQFIGLDNESFRAIEDYVEQCSELYRP